MSNTMNELMSLVEHEIPEARQNLLDNHGNLEKVAEYCETNYFQAENKRLALEETKNYATQSLASVAYQINTLAYNLLHMLDLQGSHLGEMESQINNIAQTISIHKEKVARREIGILTTNKCIVSQHKILVPANAERQIKYQRKPIDYSILDEIGHGVKILPVNTPRSKRVSSASGIYGETGMSGQAPTSKPPNPPQTLSRHGGSGIGLGIGSLSRGSKEYRTPVPVIAPPQVPSNYAPNYPQGHPRAQDSRRGSGYSTLPLSMAHAPGGGQVAAAMQQMSSSSLGPSAQKLAQVHQAPPQVGMVHPITQMNVNGGKSASQNYPQPSSTPPPPPPPPPTDLSHSPDALPPPPFHHQHINQHVNSGHASDHADRLSNNVTPPLPSPPPLTMDEPIYNHGAPPNNDDWVPKEYIEKVVAIYDYAANRNDELSFHENSVIYVIKKNDDGWYEGVMGGITGLFPGNYVEPCR